MDLSLRRIFGLHIVFALCAVCISFVHVFVLHLWLSSCCIMDRCMSYSELYSFMCHVFVRDVVLVVLMCVVYVRLCAISWCIVFHEESFQCYSALQTASKVLPEWFFM